MSIHKAFTRVTPLSKTLALILFILLPFIGFYFGSKYQQALDLISNFPQLSVVTSSPAIPKPTAQSILDFFISYKTPKGWTKSIDEKTGAIILRSSAVAHATTLITGMEIVISRNGAIPTSPISTAPQKSGIASPHVIQTITVGKGKGLITYSDNPQPEYTVISNQGTDVWKFTFTYSKSLESTAGTIRDNFLSSVAFQQPIGL